MYVCILDQKHALFQAFQFVFPEIGHSDPWDP